MNHQHLLFGLALAALASIASGCSSISIRTAVEIDAPRERVYAALADFESYPGWNPYHRGIEGEFAQGAALSIDVLRPDGKRVRVPPRLLRIAENEEITWGGGVRGLFYGEHSFVLEAQADGKTLLRHNEDFSGIAIGFADLPADVIAEGYHRVNSALKAMLENEN